MSDSEVDDLLRGVRTDSCVYVLAFASVPRLDPPHREGRIDYANFVREILAS